MAVKFDCGGILILNPIVRYIYTDIGILMVSSPRITIKANRMKHAMLSAAHCILASYNHAINS